MIGGLLREHDFRLFWIGETTSSVAGVTWLALPLVAVIVLRAGTFQVSALTAADRRPCLLVGLPAGAWVDRMRRRPVLIAGDLAAKLAAAGRARSRPGPAC